MMVVTPTQAYVKELCMVEQDLAMGSDAEGRTVQQQEQMKNIYPILNDTSIKIEDKLRILLLYIQANNGINSNFIIYF